MKRDDLERYIEGHSSQQEKEQIAKWLDADQRNMQEFLRLRRLYDISFWNSPGAGNTSYQRIGRPKKRTNRILSEIAKIAAIFLLALGVHYFFLSGKGRSEKSILTAQSFYVPEGQRSEVILSDGTKVWLNAKSTLTFPSRFNDTARIVGLHGEAYFDVAHNPENKFIVKTEGYHIRVLGTEFNVISYPEKKVFETALIRGSVEISQELSNNSLVLSPEQKASFVDGYGLIASPITSHDQFLWKKGILVFENEPVQDIFEKLEHYYDVNITSLNDNLSEHRYTGKFWIKDGVEQVLKVLQLRQNFTYKIDDMNQITIFSE